MLWYQEKKKTFSYDCKQTDNFSDYCFNKKVSFWEKVC